MRIENLSKTISITLKNKMHISFCFGCLIFTRLISTIYSGNNQLSPDQNENEKKVPGPINCMYYGAINNICPEFRPLPPSIFEDQCNSFFYDGITVNSNSQITIAFDNNKNKNVHIRHLLETSKDVILFYGYESRKKWEKVLGCIEPNTTQYDTDINELLKFYIEHGSKIKGFNLMMFEPDDEYGYPTYCPNFSKNLKSYIDKMKEIMPGIKIGINIVVSYIFNYTTKYFSVEWLNIDEINESVDFYLVSFSKLNQCINGRKSTGIVPVEDHSNNKINTMTSVHKFVMKLGIKKEKLLYRIQINGVMEYANDKSPVDTCETLYTEICRLQIKNEYSYDVCADTEETLHSKGKFAKENASGLVVYAVDFDGSQEYCKCDEKFPAFNAIVNGYQNENITNNCALLNRTYP